VSLEQLACFN